MNWRRRLLKLLREGSKDILESIKSPKPLIIIICALLLIMIGQIGLLIPIFPGLLFTIPGLVLLSLFSPTIYRTLKRTVSKHPRIESITDRTRNWLINHIKPRQ